MDMNKTFHTICVAHMQAELFVDPNSNTAKTFSTTVSEMLTTGIKSGEVVPLNVNLFEMNQVEEAFRFLASGKHIGKVVIKIRDEKDEPTPTNHLYSCVAQTFFDPTMCHLVIGGLGGIGLELIHWLAEKGAKNIAITSRNGVVTAYQKLSLQKLRNMQVRVEVIQKDATTEESARAIIEKASELGPIESIFNLAVILCDADFKNQTIRTFELACKPKVHTTFYLDRVSRQLCPDLKYFVCFSSAVSGKGNRSQTNYAFGNSALERICDQRRRDGLHGLAVQYGAVADVGIVAEIIGTKEVNIVGSLPQRIHSCLEVLDKFMQMPYSVCSSAVVANVKAFSSQSKDEIFIKICHILGIQDSATLDPDATLGEVGLDSLLAVEIKQRLEADYDIMLSNQEIRNLKIKDVKNIENVRNAVKKNEGLKTSEGDFRMHLLKAPKQFCVNLNTNTGMPIYIFPSFDGNFDDLKKALENLSRPVIGLNWTKEMDEYKNVQQVAARYICEMNKVCDNISKYDLVGYSFGGLIAFEVARQLQQKHGKNSVRTLTLIDGAPKQVQKIYCHQAELNHFHDENLKQVEMINEFAIMFFKLEINAVLKNELLKLTSKKKRFEKVCQLIKLQAGIECDADQLEAAVNRYYKKLNITLTYEPETKLEGDLFFFKAEEECQTLKSIVSQDYQLSEVINDTS